MPRTDSGYPRNFMVNSWIFQDDESESDAKTNSRQRVTALGWKSALGIESTCTESVLGTLCQHKYTCLYTQIYAWCMPGSENIISKLLIKKMNFISLLKYVWFWINFNLQW